MIDVHFDFETYSEANIKEVGGVAYAEHPSTDVICMSYAYGDEEPRLWLPGEPLPKFLKEEHFGEYRLFAHNSQFEYCIVSHVMKLKPAPLEYWVDTAAMAAALSLPRALFALCEVIGVNAKDAKDSYGGYLIRKLSIPQKYTKKQIKEMGLEEDATYRNRDPELLGKMYEYCRQDVNAERACAKHMLPLSDEEQKVWETDQIINLRGVNVDVDKVKDCIAIYEKKIEQLMEELKKMTGLENPNSQKQFLEWATKHGYTEDNLKAETLRDFLYVYRGREGEDILTQAITLKTMLSRTAPKKFYALLRRLSEDGRHRGAFMFHGAGTGRWASLGINLQNLLRPLMKDVDFIIELLGDRDPDILDLLWGDAITAIASCVRGMLIASPGNRLIICDYSAVEARIIAWLAGEQAVLEVFRQGKDVYIHAASGIFKIGESEVGPDERFAGKTAILACGFQGGWSALQKMASNYGVELEDGFCMMIVKKWRKANPRIVAYWAALERAAIEAVRNPGQEFLVEDFMEEKGKIPSVKYKVARGFLFCQLPSGRCLAYASPGLEKKTVRLCQPGAREENCSLF
jgi:DNA polymerase